MRRDWDKRAKENAKHFIATSQAQWSDEDFFRTGFEGVQGLVGTQLQDICAGRSPSDMRVLEIGCGAGRMTLPLSHLFGHVDAVDVSPEMIRLARAGLRERANVSFYVTNGMDLSMFPDRHFDFAVSFIVFQHIPKRAIIENYIEETWRVLRPGSRFTFQVQGCPITEEEANTWVGVGFTENQMQEIARRLDFEIRNSFGAGTQYYYLTFLKL